MDNFEVIRLGRMLESTEIEFVNSILFEAEGTV
jgi:hypothetical protein